MKCAACGYEKSDFCEMIEKVVKYKSGKNKGKIKGWETVWIEPDKDKDSFDTLSSEYGGEFQVHGRDKSIYVCPKCGTLKMKIP